MCKAEEPRLQRKGTTAEARKLNAITKSRLNTEWKRLIIKEKSINEEFAH